MNSGWQTMVEWLARSGKRIGVAVVGFALLAAGLVMMVTPGPGLLVVIAGLAVLATEFAWARGLLDKTRHKWHSATDRLRRKPPSSASTPD